MPRAKKSEETATIDTRAVQAEVKEVQLATEGDFRQAVIDLGLRICKDYEDGRVRPEAPLVNALTELFKAVKQ